MTRMIVVDGIRYRQEDAPVKTPRHEPATVSEPAPADQEPEQPKSKSTRKRS